jgi:CxxC-x17-CxxC domain-containing protein
MADFDMKNHEGGRRNSGRRDSGKRNFDRRDSRDRDRGEFRPRGDRRDSRPRDRGPVTMHSVVCDDCGEKCEVPFKPSSDKPIYCDDCFKKNKSSGSNGTSSRSLDQINEKLDTILSLLKKSD